MSLNNNSFNTGNYSLVQSKSTKYFGSPDGLNILYLEGESNYTIIYLIDNKKILISKTMKHLMAMLPSTNFLRIHKSYIINKQHAKLYSNNKKFIIKLENGIVLPISRTKKKNVKLNMCI